MNKTYTVKKLDNIANVSVRTLHHYDQIGLLKPSVIGENGFWYEFDVWNCGENSLLDISRDSERIEVGLIKGTNGIPKVELKQFNLEPFTI